MSATRNFSQSSGKQDHIKDERSLICRSTQLHRDIDPRNNTRYGEAFPI